MNGKNTDERRAQPDCQWAAGGGKEQANKSEGSRYDGISELKGKQRDCGLVAVGGVAEEGRKCDRVSAPSSPSIFFPLFWYEFNKWWPISEAPSVITGRTALPLWASRPPKWPLMLASRSAPILSENANYRLKCCLEKWGRKGKKGDELAGGEKYEKR